MRERIRDKERLLHITESIDFILQNTIDTNYETFTTNKLLYGAVVYYTMVIGEACYKLTNEFKQKHPNTPWNDITSMRHHLVHGYYQVDSRVLWEIISNDLPLLKTQIKQYLNEF
ncbi:MAG: DUF86 domain-containing protein [Bacteroidales bacterium]|nr:DUF86 domain-containing protein [Bacteroidales bacterium]